MEETVKFGGGWTKGIIIEIGMNNIPMFLNVLPLLKRKTSPVNFWYSSWKLKNWINYSTKKLIPNFHEVKIFMLGLCILVVWA